MSQIRFIHQCHVDGVLYQAGSVVEEKLVPPKILTQFLAAGFVERVTPGAAQPPAKPVVP